MRRSLLLFALVLTACSSSTAPDPTGTVVLQFKHFVGENPLVLGSMTNVNAAGNTYSVETLQYYVSDVRFAGPDGIYEEGVVHYVDAADHDTHTLTITGIVPRHYHTISFTFGLSAERNVTGALGGDQVHLNMQWPEAMGGGYHYMKLEGRFERVGAVPQSYRSHTGRLRDPDGTEHHHDFRMTVTPHMTVGTESPHHVELLMDINQWYENPNVINLETHADGIMGNTAAQDLMEANGATVCALGMVDGGGHDEHDDMP